MDKACGWRTAWLVTIGLSASALGQEAPIPIEPSAPIESRVASPTDRLSVTPVPSPAVSGDVIEVPADPAPRVRSDPSEVPAYQWPAIVHDEQLGVLNALGSWIGWRQVERDRPAWPARGILGWVGKHGLLNSDFEPTPGQRWRVQAETIFWWTPGADRPPLVTTGPATFPVATLDIPTTQIVVGGPMNDYMFPGGRFTVAYQINDGSDGGPLAAEFSGFFLGSRTFASVVTSDTTASGVVARPFFNINENLDYTSIVAFPGSVDFPAVLRASVTTPFSTSFGGASANLVKTIREVLAAPDRWGWATRTDLVGGFAFYDLKERMAITESGQVTASNDPDYPQGQRYYVEDRFSTNNEFYGGNFGLAQAFRHNRWFVDIRTVVGFGATHQTVNVFGMQQITNPGAAPQIFEGGLLALPTNIGKSEQYRFTVAPQFTLNGGLHLTQNLRVFGGYTFLFLNNVLRPGDQIDTTLNVRQIPNFPSVSPPSLAIRPQRLMETTGFWAQGLSIGADVHW